MVKINWPNKKWFIWNRKKLGRKSMIFSDPLLFAFSLLNTGAVLFLLVYFVSFTDKQS